MRAGDSDCECGACGPGPAGAQRCDGSLGAARATISVPGTLRTALPSDDRARRPWQRTAVLQVPACDGRRAPPGRRLQTTADRPALNTTSRDVPVARYLPNELETNLAQTVRADARLRWPPSRCEFLPQRLDPNARPATPLGTAKWLVVACEDDFIVPPEEPGPPGGLGVSDPGDDARALNPELLYKLSYRFRCAGRWYHEQGFQFAVLQTVQGRAAIAELGRVDRTYDAGVFDPAGAIETPTAVCFDGDVPAPGQAFRQPRLWGSIVPNESYVVVQVRPWRQERDNPLQPIRFTVDAAYDPNKARVFISGAVDPSDGERIVDFAEGRRFDQVHELFHAVQWHLAPTFMSKANGSYDYHWVTEGMAGAVTLRLRMFLSGGSVQQTIDQAFRAENAEGIRRRDWGVALNGLPPRPAANGQRAPAWSTEHRLQARSGGGLVLFCVRADQSIGYLAPLLAALERESGRWPNDAARLPASYSTMHQALSAHASELQAQPAPLTGLKAAYVRAVVLSGQYYAPQGLADAAASEWRREIGCGGGVSQIPGPRAPFPNDLAPFESKCAAFQSTNGNQPRLRFDREDMPRQGSVYYILQGATSLDLNGLVVSNLARVDAPGAAGEIVQFNICRFDEMAGYDTTVRASTRVSTR